MFLNCVFLDDLPIEFFYTDNISYAFGGISIFYLGSYSYGSLNTKESESSSTLGRYDGFETSGTLVGQYSVKIGNVIWIFSKYQA